MPLVFLKIFISLTLHMHVISLISGLGFTEDLTNYAKETAMSPC